MQEKSQESVVSCTCVIYRLPRTKILRARKKEIRKKKKRKKGYKKALFLTLGCFTGFQESLESKKPGRKDEYKTLFLQYNLLNSLITTSLIQQACNLIKIKESRGSDYLKCPFHEKWLVDVTM